MSRLSVSMLALGALLLTSCSRHELLIVTDQYWQASVLEGSRFTSGLAHFSQTTGVGAKTVVVPFTASDSARLVGTIGDNDLSPVVLSPLYSPHASALAAQFPDRRFVAFASMKAPSGGTSNLVYLVSDPTDIFRTAARRVAVKLAAESRGGAVPVIAGVFSDDAAGQAALAGFRAGLDGADVQPQLLTIHVSGEADRSRLRSFLETSQAHNAVLYVLAAPALDSYAAELLKDNTVPIVAQSWKYGAAYSDKVIFSVDKDIPSALRRVVETMGRPSDNEIRIPWNIVTGSGGS